MHELGNDWNKAYKKSARIVGDVIGKYHPHGDSAVYDTMVRMAQPFSLRYLLIDGQGNFGSVDGDAAAAMRYTEVRLTRVAHEMLGDIDKETVDFVPNYDESEHEPSVLPTRVPNLLVNGSAGIAVGMATNIPPHNLCEIIDACIMVIDKTEVTLAQLMEIVKGPDFPTGGIINGIADLGNAYRNGRGRVRVRARTHFEDISSGRQAIIVTELPYQVNKARLLERIAELHKEKLVEGISEIRDESDKDGMRIVFDLKRGESAEVLLNNLSQQTRMESAYHINIVALVDGQPRTLDLRTLLDCFLSHRREVVTRRTLFDLRKARERAHILEGFAVALAPINLWWCFVGVFLGTVVGVMITFAAIAAAGDVNVNAIAPGIAAALVATVAGLAVAIPALFGYNGLASQIKNVSADMTVFADEFLTKAAELHST
jgi:DNA gyrase subunit A